MRHVGVSAVRRARARSRWGRWRRRDVAAQIGEGSSEVEVQVRWICRRAARVPISLALLPSGILAVAAVRAAEIIERGECRLEARREQKRGVLLVLCSEHALSEGAGTGAELVGEMADGGHQPERAVLRVEEYAGLARVATISGMLNGELSACSSGSADDGRHAIDEKVGVGELAPMLLGYRRESFDVIAVAYNRRAAINRIGGANETSYREGAAWWRCHDCEELAERGASEQRLEERSMQQVSLRPPPVDRIRIDQDRLESEPGEERCETIRATVRP